MLRKKRLLCIALLAATLSFAGLGGGLAQAAEVSPAGPPIPPAAGLPPAKMALAILTGHGRPQFLLLGERVRVFGAVFPYVAGQQIVVNIYRDGRRVLSRRVALTPQSNGIGRFRLDYSSPRTGLVTVHAEHVTTPQLVAVTARAVSVRYEPSTIGMDARGPAVLWLQRELAGLHYEVPVTGYFDAATGRAVLALRKVIGLERVESANARVFGLLQSGAGRFHVRYPGDGNHIEADLSKQVLVEVERGGRVRRIFTMSSGKPSTPTVLGRFRVYSKTPGTNSEGMVDSNYFIRGYAIHGYAEVPAYAASHGCLRIPIPNAAAVYGWVQIGYPVDVYTDNGRGSRVVRSDAGP
jgi:L,D-transpeptidase catalytic domain